MIRIVERLLILWAEIARRAGIWLALAIVLAGMFAAVIAASNLRVNTDTSTMLNPELDFQQRARELRAAFPQAKSEILVIMRGDNPDDVRAYAQALDERLRTRPDVFETVFSAARDPFFLQNGLLFLETNDLGARMLQLSKASNLIERLIKTPTLGAFFSALADNDDLANQADLGADDLDQIYGALNTLITQMMDGQPNTFSWEKAIDNSDDGAPTTLLLNVKPALDYSRLQPAKPAMQVLRAETNALAPQFAGRVDAFISGDPALRVEEMEAVTTGIGLSFMLSFIIVSLLLLMAYRSALIALVTMIGLLLTLAFTSAFAALVVGELNLVSVAFTVLLVGLGLDFAIHLLLHVQERRDAGQSGRRALRGAVREVGPALAIAAPTTALAFLAFMPTDFDGIAQLGLIAGVGVMIALIVSVTFIPAVLARLKVKQIRKPGGYIRKAFAGLDHASKPIAITTIVLGAAALFVVPMARFDADQMALRAADAPSVLGFNLLFEDKNTAPYRLSLITENADGARAIAERAKQIDKIDSTRSLLSFVPDDQDDKLDLIDAAAGTLVFALDAQPGSVVGPSREEGAWALQNQLESDDASTSARQLGTALKHLLNQPDTDALLNDLEGRVFAHWPALIETLSAQMEADYVTIDDLPAPIQERYVAADGRWRVDLIPAEDLRPANALRAFIKAVEPVFPNLAGGAYQAQRAGDTIAAAMLQATIIAFVLVAFFLWFFVRELTTIVLVLVPLLLAALLTVATSALANIPFNYANVIVLPLLIGIGVDSGVHLVMRERQVEAGEGIYGTSTPRAVLFSALTTLASFGSLMLSPHRGTASMGALLAIAIGFTLLCTLVVLPAAFKWRNAHRARAKV